MNKLEPHGHEWSEKQLVINSSNFELENRKYFFSDNFDSHSLQITRDDKKKLYEKAYKLFKLLILWDKKKLSTCYHLFQKLVCYGQQWMIKYKSYDHDIAGRYTWKHEHESWFIRLFFLERALHCSNFQSFIFQWNYMLRFKDYTQRSMESVKLKFI